MSVLGKSSRIAIGQQSAQGTPATTLSYIDLYGITGGSSRSREPDNILSGAFHNLFDNAASYPGLTQHSLELDLPTCINQFPLILKMLGALTSSGSSPNFVYNQSSGAAALNYHTIVHQRQSGDIVRHSDLVMNSLGMSFAKEAGFQQMKLGLLGRAQATLSDLTGLTLNAAQTLSRPAKAGFTVSWGGTVIGRCTSASFDFNRNIKQEYYLDGAPDTISETLRDDAATCTGQFNVRYLKSAVDTLLADADAGTSRALEILATVAANRTFEFRLESVRLNRPTIDIAGPGLIDVPINWVAEQTAASPMIVFGIRNGVAASAYA